MLEYYNVSVTYGRNHHTRFAVLAHDSSDAENRTRTAGFTVTITCTVYRIGPYPVKQGFIRVLPESFEAWDRARREASRRADRLEFGL